MVRSFRVTSEIVAAAQHRRLWLTKLARYFLRFVSRSDHPILCPQLQIEALCVLKSRQSGVKPKAVHFVLVGSARVEDGHSDSLHELSMTEEHNRAGLVGQTAQPAQRYLGTSEQRGETLHTWPVAIHRVGGVPVVLDVG